MKSPSPLTLLVIGCFCSTVAQAQLEYIPDKEAQRVFAGKVRKITVVWHNVGNNVWEAAMRTRLYQTSSTTALRMGELPWKKLQVLPGQTIVESVTLDIPSVKAETRFLIQWIEGATNVVGRTEVFVYPTNLLTQIEALADDHPIGIFDPNNELAPILQALGIGFEDLAEAGTDKFRGKLAICGPFETRSQMRASLKDDLRALAKRGVAVVWLQPPAEKPAPLKPSFYIVREGEGAIVVAEHGLVAHPAESPEAQLNLLHLAEMALRPPPIDLPETQTSN